MRHASLAARGETVEGARPSMTPCAPSASALSTSEPRRNPPSTSIGELARRPPPTTWPTSSMPVAAQSSCRPPWFDSTMPSAPHSIAAQRVLDAEDAFQDQFAFPALRGCVRCRPSSSVGLICVPMKRTPCRADRAPAGRNSARFANSGAPFGIMTCHSQRGCASTSSTLAGLSLQGSRVVALVPLARAERRHVGGDDEFVAARPAAARSISRSMAFSSLNGYSWNHAGPAQLPVHLRRRRSC